MNDDSDDISDGKFVGIELSDEEIKKLVAETNNRKTVSEMLDDTAKNIDKITNMYCDMDYWTLLTIL